MKKKILLIPLALLLAVSLLACAAPAPAPAPAPVPAPAPTPAPAPAPAPQLAKSISAFMSIGLENDEAIAKYIKEKLGVEIEIFDLSCGKIHARLKAEAPRFSADMALAACGPQAADAKEYGWSVPYASPPWQGAGELWVDPDNHWCNFGNLSFVLVGNKAQLAAKGYTIPDSWEDLLDPKWKDEIVMPSPLESGTAFMMLYSFMALKGGEEEGWEYIEALDKNIHHYAASGSAPLELVGRGEFMLGLCSDSKVLMRMQEGYPIVWTVPKEGTGYDSHACFILKGTDKEYTCQKIVDELATHEFAELISSLVGYISKDTGVTSAFYGGTEYPSVRPLPGGRPNYIPNIDVAWAYENEAKIKDDWKDRIGRVTQ